MPLQNENIYTTDHIYSLPEGQRAELINGVIYNMAPPSRLHQELVMSLSSEIRNYIKKIMVPARYIQPPFAVFLNEDNQNYVEPDISVICDSNKLDEKGCNDTHDWIIEVVPPVPNAWTMGLNYSNTAGVREYWIVNPLNQTVNVYDLITNDLTDQYSFDDDIPFLRSEQ